MERRIACPGSVSVDNKDIPSDYSDEGTLAHNISADLLKALTSSHAYSKNVPDEMLAYIRIYTDYIKSLKGERHIEIEVILNFISNDIGGTADCIVKDWPTRLHVSDLKYGKGKLIEPVGNAQLATYGLGALERFGDDYKEIWLTIVQPRIEHKDGPIRHWKTTPEALQKTWYPKIKKAYEKSISHPNLFKPGNHCMWCSGAHECVKAQKESNAIIKASEKGITADNKKLAKLLESETMIREYLKLAKLEAFKRLKQGEKIPGFKLVRNFGNTTWISQTKAEKQFNDSDNAWKRVLKTPNQLKKLAFSSNLITKLSHRPDEGLIVVPDTDKRQAYLGAADDFDDEVSL